MFYAVDSRRVFGGRYVNAWLAASLLAVLCTVSYLAAAQLDHPTWLITIGNTTMVAAVAAVWAGCRAFNTRSLALPVVLPVLLVVAAGALLPSQDGPQWAGTGVKLLALSLFSAFTAFESRRGRLGTSRASWLLSIAHTVHALYSAARFIAYTAGGIDGAVFSRYFNTTITTTINMSFVVLTTLALVLLRLGELQARRAHSRGERAITLHQLRARQRSHPGAALLIMDIDDLGVIRTAYGPAHVDELIDQLLAATLRFVPQPLGISVRRSGTVLVLFHAEPRADLDTLSQLIIREYGNRSAKLVEGYAQVLRISIEHSTQEH